MFSKMMNSFYYGKSGKGDFRKEDLPKNRWQLFWEMLRIRFSSLCRLNLMTVAAWLPMIILIGYCISTAFNGIVVVEAYQNFLETGDMGSLTEQQIAFMQQYASTGSFLNDMLLSMAYTFCLWCIPCILITGPVQAGLAYVTRNWARDEHAFIWSDFKDAVKENWKQGLGVSAITAILPIVLYISVQFYGQQAQSSVVFVIPQMIVIMLGAVWALGLTFMYPMMVTYRVKFSELIKNSVLMAIARLPQTVGIRLLMLVPIVLCLVVFFFTGSLIAFLVLGGYYILLGYAFSRFVFASYTNGVFDKYINSRMAGVQVNRGLASEEEDEEENEEETEEQTPPADPQ